MCDSDFSAGVMFYIIYDLQVCTFDNRSVKINCESTIRLKTCEHCDQYLVSVTWKTWIKIVSLVSGVFY